MRPFASAIGALALCGAAIAQDPVVPPAFDVADVHASPQGTKESGLYLHGRRMELHGVTMLRLITMAYGVDETKVFGGPNWLDSDRFEIVAMGGAPLAQESLPAMMRALLADRFQLKVRNEDK